MENLTVTESVKEHPRIVIVPLLDDKNVEVKEITYGEWETTRNEGNHFDNDVALVRACTGISVDDLEEMDAPDFNELKRACIKINNPVIELEAGETIIPLSEPIILLTGTKSKDIVISMPKVKHCRQLDKISEASERINYMIKAATGIIDLRTMRMSDYSLLVTAVPSFFIQGAAFFRAIQ